MVQELECQDCGSTLGWKIVKSFERSEKWKENAFLLELETLQQVDVDVDEVFNEYYRSPVTVQKPNDRAGSPGSDAEDSDQGPKTPIPRFTRLAEDSVVLADARQTDGKQHLKVETSLASDLGPSPPSAAVSFFDLSTSDNEEDEASTPLSLSPPILPIASVVDVEAPPHLSLGQDAASGDDVPPSPTSHRRVASLEPTATEPKAVLPRRPSEPVIVGVGRTIPLAPTFGRKTSPGTFLNARAPPAQELPTIPTVAVPLNSHDSLASEIDRMARDLQPILEGLPKSAESTPEQVERTLSAKPPSPVSVTEAEPAVTLPTASTLRLRRPSSRGTLNRPSFAEQTLPPMPAGAVMHVRKLSNTSSPSHSPKSSISGSPSLAPSPLPSTASSPLSSTHTLPVPPQITPATSRTMSPSRTPPPPVTVVPPSGVRFKEEVVDIDESARQEKARVADLTRVLALDGSIPPLTPRTPSTGFMVAVAAQPVPSMPALPDEVLLTIPGRTLPFPRAPTPDGALLANRTVRKRALSQPGRRPSLGDLRAGRTEPEPALPAPIPRNGSPSGSRVNSVLDANGTPVVTTRLPAMTKRPSLRNLAAESASSTASLPIPRKGSLVPPDSRPASRATSVIDVDERPRVVTTRLPAMAARRTRQNEDAPRAVSFFDTDPSEPSKVATRLPAMKRRPSVPELSLSNAAASVEPSLPTGIRSKFSMFSRKR
jgi:hypothetical protein